MKMLIDNSQEKQAFAEALLRCPGNPYQAAMSICNSSQRAVQIAEEWLHDPEVAEYKKELIEKYGEEYFLPTKAEMIHKIYARGIAAARDDDFFKGMKLIAEMRGMIEKPGVTVNNNVTTNKVMVIPSNNSDEEWEQRLVEQQKKLTSSRE